MRDANVYKGRNASSEEYATLFSRDHQSRSMLGAQETTNQIDIKNLLKFSVSVATALVSI
ncbi:Protein kinase family protein [Corchorus olitorius]|uniref:Protein kinase family protein n=1 Tax=Corchorus olitorius TaxID=93759 RepID=A0A1R3HDU6_9ROSI|nr:Protein kinase family protein [Corchorus olitorius]